MNRASPYFNPRHHPEWYHCTICHFVLQRALWRRNDSMGLTYNKYLEGDKIYGCKKCRTHLAVPNDLISKTFHGRHGKAYLFNAVSNITTSEQEERGMTTGRHLVRDISCRQCGTCVGWKYDKAYEEDQTYKEGKFILEYELLRDVK